VLRLSLRWLVVQLLIEELRIRQQPFAFGANAGVDLRQSQGYPVNHMPVGVPLEELDSNSVLAHVPVSSPRPSTTLGANKKRRRLDDGPSETKRMK
jgi:hypothetical protein